VGPCVTSDGKQEDDEQTSRLDNHLMEAYNRFVRSIRLSIVFLVLTVVCACRQAGPPAGDQAATVAPMQSTAAPNPAKDLAYVCPMDPDIRSAGPGKCTRCGMALVAGIPEPVEFHLDLTVTPATLHANEPAELTFEVFDPWKDRRVEKFSIVHEKLFHAFVVSRDLQFFLHDHPTWENGAFHYTMKFPQPGMYRILGDFYPEAATPQLLPKTVFVAGPEAPVVSLTRDYSQKRAENLTVDFSINPTEPTAGLFAQMRFKLDPGDGLERYLGAWGHMLAASDDLIDMIHTHPFIADGREEMQFNLVFPRAHIYRVWVQFQRNGVVNTVHFDIPVNAAPAAAAN
jgi:hypothetical protein